MASCSPISVKSAMFKKYELIKTVRGMMDLFSEFSVIELYIFRIRQIGFDQDNPIRVNNKRRDRTQAEPSRLLDRSPLTHNMDSTLVRYKYTDYYTKAESIIIQKPSMKFSLHFVIASMRRWTVKQLIRPYRSIGWSSR